MLSRIRAFIFLIEFPISIAIVTLLMFLFRKHHRKIRQLWGKVQRFFIGYKPNIIGKVDKRANLLIINHQSLLDIVILEDIHYSNIAWCAKKELFDNFITHPVLALPNMIRVDRSDKRAIIKLIKDTEDRLKDGRVIAIFPEGTRGNGDKLLKFQLGAKVLAEKLDLKIQPVIISGARDIFDMKNFKINPGKVDIFFMPLINSKNNENWYENLYTSMQKELTKLRNKK